MSREYQSVLPRSRSPLSRLSINPRSEASPNKSSIKQISLKRLESNDIDAFIEKLQSNRQNLCTCFDIFQLLFQNGVPQRCITHNNFVTLYCQTEQKLLCVNCMYSTVIHRNHNVGPIKDSFDKIHQDNRVNEKKLKQVVQMLSNLHQRVLNVVSDCKQGLQKTLHELNSQYDYIQKILVQKYEIIRQSTIERYSMIASKHKALQKQLAWLKQTYTKREINLPRSQEEAAELYEHVLLNALLDPEKINLKIVDEFNNEEIKNQQLSQFIKIRTFLETGRQKDKKRIF